MNICTQCGFQNEQEAKFCRMCGTVLGAGAPVPPQTPPQPQPPSDTQQPPPTDAQQPTQSSYYNATHQQQPTQGFYQPQYPQPPASKPKTKTGLIIGLVAGGIVLIAAAVLLYLLVFSGVSVEGQWYNAQRGWVLSFGSDGTLEKHSLEGIEKAKYEYDKAKGQGALAMSDTRHAFRTNDSRLEVRVEGETLVFEKLDQDEKIEKYVLRALEGIWISEEIGEVLKLEDGRVYVYSQFGDYKGGYEYDILKGEGAITLHSEDYEIRATHKLLDIKDVGIYTKTDEDIDIKAYLAKLQPQIVGVWYEAEGKYGTITFNADGTASIDFAGEVYQATYTFDAANSQGTLTAEETVTFTLKDGLILIDGYTYTREYVEQHGAQTMTPAGIWYESTGYYGSATFNEDGTVVWYEFGETYYGTYTFNPVDGLGEVFIWFGDQTVQMTFSYDGYMLYLGEDLKYTRDYVQEVVHIIGMWYDMAGETGTIVFDQSGWYYMDTYGLTLTNTYTFDAATFKGALTMQLQDEPFLIDIYLENNLLDVDGRLYTRRYVKQPYYEEPVVG